MSTLSSHPESFCSYYHPAAEIPPFQTNPNRVPWIIPYLCFRVICLWNYRNIHHSDFKWLVCSELGKLQAPKTGSMSPPIPFRFNAFIHPLLLCAEHACGAGDTVQPGPPLPGAHVLARETAAAARSQEPQKRAKGALSDACASRGIFQTEKHEEVDAGRGNVCRCGNKNTHSRANRGPNTSHMDGVRGTDWGRIGKGLDFFLKDLGNVVEF